MDSSLSRTTKRIILIHCPLSKHSFVLQSLSLSLAFLEGYGKKNILCNVAQMNSGAFRIPRLSSWSLIKIETDVALALIGFPYYEETIPSRTYAHTGTHNINIQLLLSLFVLIYFQIESLDVNKEK